MAAILRFRPTRHFLSATERYPKVSYKSPESPARYSAWPERNPANDAATCFQRLCRKHRQDQVEHLRSGVSKPTGEGEKERVP